jgi:HEAT repeat protein
MWLLISVCVASTLPAADPSTSAPAGAQSVADLAKTLREGNAEARAAAAEALGNLGPAAKEAIGDLIDHLTDKDVLVRINVSHALGRVGTPAIPALVKIIEIGESEAACDAAGEALHDMGAEARQAVPVLLEVLRKGEIVPVLRAFAAGRALAGMGPSAVAGLVEIFKETETDILRGLVRMQSLKALSEIGPDAVAAAPVLAEALGKRDEPFREHIAAALCHIRPGDLEGLAALEEGLSAKRAIDRKLCAGFLGELGLSAAAAVPALARATVDQDASVRSQAALAMGRIGWNGTVAVPTLVRLLTDSDTDVRKKAATALGLCALKPEKAVPALAKALHDENANVRAEAALALAEYGVAARTAAPALAEALQDEKEWPSLAASNTLLEIGGDPAAIGALAKVLKDSRASRRAAAASILQSCGPGAANALSNCLGDSDPKVRRAAYASLAYLGEAGKAAVPGLIEMTKDQDANTRSFALGCLERVGPPATVVAAARPALHDTDPSVRMSAATALGNLGSVAAAAAPDLLSLTKDANAQVRISSALAVCKAAPGHVEDVLPVIRAELTGSDLQNRVAAATAMLELPGQSAAALKVLREILETTKNGGDRLTAVQALRAPGAPASEVIPLIREALRDEDIGVNNEAIAVAADLGPAVRALGPDLVPLLHRPVIGDSLGGGSPIRRLALNALWKIDPALAEKVAPR